MTLQFLLRPTRKLVNPWCIALVIGQLQHLRSSGKKTLTSINLINDRLLNHTSVLLLGTLHQQRSAPVRSAIPEEAVRVHGPLQRISLPPKHVITVSRVTRFVAGAPDKRLAAVLWPEGLVVEHCSVPHGLVSHLRHADRMRSRAGRSNSEPSLARVVHVRHVVRGIKVLAVPASATLHQ